MHTSFAPMLLVGDGNSAIEFYKKAFHAKLERLFANPDGSVHVAEMSIDQIIFHIREVNPDRGHFDPLLIKGVTSLVELWVEDAASVFASAIVAGAKELYPVKDHAETGYRQGTLLDPFGHQWHIMRPIPRSGEALSGNPK